MHRTDIQVRFGDTDALGHLNNAAYATYAETARLEFFRAFGNFLGSLILAHLSIDYRRQVRYGEVVYVESGIEKIGRSSFTVRHVVYGSGELAAEVVAIVVCFDYATQKSMPIPDDMRVKLEAAK